MVVGGLMAAWHGFVLRPTGERWYLLPIIIVWGSVIGAVTGWIACYFTRKVHFSVGRFVFLIVLLGGITTLTGEIVFAATWRLPQGQWVQMPPPPEPPRDFVGASCYSLGQGAVFVQTESGMVYRYDDSQLDNVWQRVDNFNEVPERFSLAEGCDSASLMKYRPPRAPGQIVAQHVVFERGADCRSQTYYVLLRDGTLWRWRRSECALATLIFAGLEVVVAVVASLLGGATLVFPKRWRVW